MAPVRSSWQLIMLPKQKNSRFEVLFKCMEN